MSSRALLLLNPNARQVGDESFDIATALRALGLTVTEASIGNPATIGDTIRRHVGAIDRVIIGGGDGTLGASAQVMVETGLPLGILPMGTANNLARTIGIPKDLEAACTVAAGASSRRIDVGEVNGRCYLTAASFGLSVAITDALSDDAKSRWGRLAYVFAAARVFARARRVDAKVQWNGRTIRTRTVQVVVGNGRYYGSALQVANDAAIDDHMLDLYSIEVQRWWQLLALGPALKRGTHGEHNAVHALRAREFTITTSHPCRIDADGELVGETPATFRVRPRALTVFCDAPD